MQIPLTGICIFYLCERDSKTKSQYAGGILLPPVQKLVATIIFTSGENVNESLSAYHASDISLTAQKSTAVAVLFLYPIRFVSILAICRMDFW
jgi:hypothetical protein